MLKANLCDEYKEFLNLTPALSQGEGEEAPEIVEPIKEEGE
jgi:hypothetical protein